MEPEFSQHPWINNQIKNLEWMMHSLDQQTKLFTLFQEKFSMF